ncbi:MAG: Flp pilus assembly protein CpaB [Parcubacteria group bacterium]
MPIRTILTLVIAAILGVIAVLLTRSYLGHQRASIAQNGGAEGMATVVVAAQPLARGVLLTPAVLKVANYPANAVPAGAFTSVQQLTTGGERRVLHPLTANQPLLPDSVTLPGGRASLSSQLTPGMRAVTFRSNDVAGVAGFVLPGDRVDVMLTRSVSGGNGQDNTLTQVIAGDVKVLGIDQVIDEKTDKPTVAKAITLELTPDQAQALPLAESLGVVSLALRHISDDLPVRRTVTTVSDLGAGGYRAVPVYRAAAPAAPMATIRHAVARAIGSTVKVTRGTETTSYSVGMN